MRLKTKFYGTMVIGFLGFALAIAAVSTDLPWLPFFAAVFLVIFALLRFLLFRCADCGDYLGRFPGVCCKHCSASLSAQ